MATLTGDVLALNRLETTFHAVGATVLVRHYGATVGTGVVTDDDNFSIELPNDLFGEIEIHLGMHNAAPTLATAEGIDLHVTLLYNNVNNFFA